MNKAFVATLQLAKLLHFAKANCGAGIVLVMVADSLEDVVFVVMAAAAWGIRSDGKNYLFLPRPP